MPDLDALARDPELTARPYEFSAPDRLRDQPDWPANWVVLSIGNSRTVDAVNRAAVDAAIDSAINRELPVAEDDLDRWWSSGTYGFTAFAFRVRVGDGFTRAFELFGELHDGMHTDGVATLDDEEYDRSRLLVQLAAICEAWPGIHERPDDGAVYPAKDDDDLPPAEHWTRQVFAWLSSNDPGSIELEETQEGDICHVTEAQVLKACVELGLLAGEAKRPAYAWPGGYPIVYYDLKAGDAFCPACAAKLPEAQTTADVHYEGEPEVCCECGNETESAYGEPGVTYIIRKVSRSGTSPYAGPSCERAGVTPGKVYDFPREALEDCAKLKEHGSPVGFSVIRLVDGKEVDDG